MPGETRSGSSTRDIVVFQRVELPGEMLPAYRQRQTERLVRNLRVSLPAGAIISLAFVPWSRMHDQTDRLPTAELGIFLALGLLLLFGLSFLDAVERWIDLLTLVGCLFTLTMVSTILVVLPNGFLYGVGALLSFTVVATVLAVDLSALATPILAVAYLVIPNAALLMTDAPWLTIMNTNWILISGAVIAFGLAFVMDRSHRLAFVLERDLAAEKARSDVLLHALLPAGIAQRLQETDDVIADVQPEATVVFADIVGFTELTRTLSPDELINLLTSVFTTLDELALDHGLEKIKTIGDAYMVAAGVADAGDRSAEDVADFALESIDAVRHFVASTGHRLDLRVGLATGPVICGVIGRRKPYFDLWGTTVNLASRLESSASQGCIHVDEQTARRLSSNFRFGKRGRILLPGIGEVETCNLIGRAEPTVSPNGLEPVLEIQHPLPGQSVSIGNSGSLPHSDIEPS